MFSFLLFGCCPLLIEAMKSSLLQWLLMTSHFQFPSEWLLFSLIHRKLHYIFFLQQSLMICQKKPYIYLYSKPNTCSVRFLDPQHTFKQMLFTQGKIEFLKYNNFSMKNVKYVFKFASHGCTSLSLSHKMVGMNHHRV